MGFGLFSPESSSTSVSTQTTRTLADNSQNADSNAQAVKDAASASSATGTSAQAVNTRGDSNVSTSAYGGAGNIQSLGSTTVAGNRGDVTITTSDPGVFRDALAQVTSLAQSNSNQLTATQDKTNALISSLAETKQTDGAAATNRNLVYVSVAALAVLGVVFYRRS